MMKNFNLHARLPAMLAASMLALSALPANAAAIDVAAVVTDIAAQAVPVGLIGMAVFLILVAVKGFKWVRKALS